MTSAPTLNAWWELFCVTAAGSTLIVACAAGLQALVRSPAWHRTIWQISTLVLGTLALVELTGVGRAIGQWVVAARNVEAVAPLDVADSGLPDFPPERATANIFASPAEPRRAGDPVGNDSINVSTADQVPLRTASLPEPATIRDDLATDVSARNELATGPELSEPIGPPAPERGAAAESSISGDVQTAAITGQTIRDLTMAREFDRTSAAPDLAGPRDRAAWWPGAVWMVGAILVALRVLTAQILLALLRLQNRTGHEPPIRERVDWLARLVGQRSRVRLLESAGLSGPIAFGLIRPTIAVPAGFAERFDPAQRDAILAHELAHLAAHDPAWHLAADLVAALFWWHPLAWWSRHQLRAASESAADEASLVIADGPNLLAACLVELGARLVRGRPAGWVGVEGSGFRSSLGRRVERLLKLNGQSWRPPSRLRGTFAKSVGLVTFLCVSILCTAWVRPMSGSKGDSPMKTVQAAWQRSVAAFVLAAAFNSSPEPLNANGSDEPPGQQNAVNEGTSDSGGSPARFQDTSDTDPAVDGAILKVEPGGNLVEISIGSDDGLRKGQKLDVIRVNPLTMVGTIEVTAAEPKKAVGKLLPETKLADPKEGDVTTAQSSELLRAIESYNKLRLEFEQARIDSAATLEILGAHKSKSPGSLDRDKEIAAKQLTITRDELHRAKERLIYSERLAKKGFLTEASLKADETAVARAELSATIAEHQVLALGLIENARESAEVFRILAAQQQKRLAEDPSISSSEKLKAIADELEQAKAKMIESFEAQIAAVRRAIEDSESQKPGQKVETKPAGQAAGGQGTAPAKKKSSSSPPAKSSSGAATKGGTQAGGAAPAAQRIRVFQLKECEPESVGNVLEQLFGAYYTNRRAGEGGMAAAVGGMPGGQPLGMGMAGGHAGGMGMGMGMGEHMGSDNVPWPPPSFRVAVDTRTKSLIVRGSEEQLKIVAEIIAALDSPLDKPAPQGQTVRVYRLRFANAAAVAQLLGRLGLSSRIAADEQANGVLVSGSKEEMEEIGELIKALDVEDATLSPTGAVAPIRPVPMDAPPRSPYSSANTPTTVSPMNRNMEIKLTSDGRLTMNGKIVEQSKLAEQLAEIRKRKTIKGGLGPGKDYFSPPPISIQVDEQLPYEQLQSLITTLAKEGFVKFTFQGSDPAVIR